MAMNLLENTMIDNDNVPAPENIPAPSESTDGISVSGSTQAVVIELWLEDTI